MFYFIGHGGDADVLFMEDGREVKTKDVVEGFASLPESMRKVFFIDACRGKGLKDPYCPTLPNSLLVRSTLPYRKAHTGGTYGTYYYRIDACGNVYHRHIIVSLKGKLRTYWSKCL